MNHRGWKHQFGKCIQLPDFTENSSQSHKLLRYISLKNVNFGDFIRRASAFS